MTRREFADWLTQLFDPFGIPVAPSPLDAARPPCLIVAPSSPYRGRDTACWVQTVDVTLVAGRMDDVDVYDRLDELADTFCRIVIGGRVVNQGAASTPTTLQLGDVDHLATAFTVTLYDLGSGLTI